MPNQIVQAYRDLLKHSLRAVQYSKPARYIYRNRLRKEFRDGDPLTFDHAKISNTVQFLKAATHDAGIEHKIVKNLSRVWRSQADQHHARYLEFEAKKKSSPLLYRTWLNAYEHYNHNIKMLNESLGTCFPTAENRQMLHSDITAWHHFQAPKTVSGKKSLLKKHYKPNPEALEDEEPMAEELREDVR